jgi:hypothetical protein
VVGAHRWVWECEEARRALLWLLPVLTWLRAALSKLRIPWLTALGHHSNQDSSWWYMGLEEHPQPSGDHTASITTTLQSPRDSVPASLPEAWEALHLEVLIRERAQRRSDARHRARHGALAVRVRHGDGRAAHLQIQFIQGLSVITGFNRLLEIQQGFSKVK